MLPEPYGGLLCVGACALGAVFCFVAMGGLAITVNRSAHEKARHELVVRGAWLVEGVRYRATALLSISWGLADVAIHDSGVYLGAAKRRLGGGGPFVRYAGPGVRAPAVSATWSTCRVERAWMDGSDLWLQGGSGLLSRRIRLRGLPPEAAGRALEVLS